MDRRERKLRHKEWLENEGKWFPIYEGVKKALSEKELSVDVQSTDVRDIAAGVLLGTLPLFFLIIYVVETKL